MLDLCSRTKPEMAYCQWILYLLGSVYTTCSIVKSEFNNGNTFLMNMNVIALLTAFVEQNLRLTSELTTFIDDVVWNSTTTVSYSPDPLKTVVFNTALLHNPSYIVHTHYSLDAALTQPSSDLDLGITSRVTDSVSTYNGMLEGWYVTSQRTTEKVTLTGLIDRVGRNVKVMVRACVLTNVYC